MDSEADLLDQKAWRAICEWHRHTTVQEIYRGYDIPLLIRPLLRSKVGTAIRSESASAAIPPVTPQQVKPIDAVRALVRKTRVWRQVYGNQSQQTVKSAVFIPYVSRPLANIVGRLVESGDWPVLSLAKEQDLSEVQRVGEVHSSLSVFSPVRIDGLLRAIVTGLANHDVFLQENDIRNLRAELEQLGKGLLRAEYTLRRYRSKLVVVHGDNHPPHYWYVFAAKKLGIPVFMLQHGLDCERYYLDEPYADYIAVWGKERKRRYEQHNRFECNIRVTGNPQYDDYKLPSQMAVSGDYWLWVTRPHSAKKCYAPSRYEAEGEEILGSLLSALQEHQGQQLVIKPHPYDDVDGYRRRVDQSGLNDRVQFSKEPPLSLYEAASLVFTEDSTAGLETMFFGKPLIHCHFAESRPTMPFVEYGAALPGFNQVDLKASIAKAVAMIDYEAMFAGQQKFIADFAYRLDSNSGSRVICFIKEVLNGESKRHL